MLLRVYLFVGERVVEVVQKKKLTFGNCCNQDRMTRDFSKQHDFFCLS